MVFFVVIMWKEKFVALRNSQSRDENFVGDEKRHNFKPSNLHIQLWHFVMRTTRARGYFWNINEMARKYQNHGWC